MSSTTRFVISTAVRARHPHLAGSVALRTLV
jgi:hypothetical protein